MVSRLLTFNQKSKHTTHSTLDCKNCNHSRILCHKSLSGHCCRAQRSKLNWMPKSHQSHTFLAFLWANWVLPVPFSLPASKKASRLIMQQRLMETCMPGNGHSAIHRNGSIKSVLSQTIPFKLDGLAQRRDSGRQEMLSGPAACEENPGSV